MNVEDINALSDANFDLEQHILRCWNITTDLEEILEDWQSGIMSEEESMQAIDAYVKVYNNRFDRTFRNYETVCHGLHSLRAIVLDKLSQESVVFTQQKSGKKSSKKVAKTVDNK
jgi:hypothetical protein